MTEALKVTLNQVFERIIIGALYAFAASLMQFIEQRYAHLHV